MASLMEDLIEVLNQECIEYDELLGLSSKKTPVIAAGDLEKLSQITDEEQIAVGKIQKLEKRRVEVMTELVRMLDKRPSEQKQLAQVRDKLKSISQHVRIVNSQNQELLEGSLEMVQFEMNILQQAGSAPETANYNKTAGTAGSLIGTNSGRFDARQ